MINQATLPLQLKKLRLSAMHSNWEELAIHAENACWTYSQYLAALCDRELAGREERHIRKLIVEAKFPMGKALDNFMFNGLKSINPAQISAFAENTNWVEQAHNLIIFGPSGVGKTHLAVAIGRRLVEKGVRVMFAKTTALVQKLQVAYKEHELPQYLAKLAKFDLIILDDIGYVKKSESESSVLFELIADRYESKSLIITSNQPFGEWDSIFPSNNMTVAAIDRLIHHATIINIEEKSYRTAQKLKQEK